ncbi:MAG TPA: hypothetical protein PK733_18005 [Clostridiales bacterium]|nr:hypothetical protein [Clostridiales bacterium]
MNNYKYFIPFNLLKETKDFLVQMGKKDKEAYVLWSGVKLSTFEFQVRGMIIPEQLAVKTAFGYAFDITASSIGKINEALFDKGEMGLIQVHSHPGESAFHSPRDDKLSVINRLGALSIVLPYFGNIDFSDFSKVKVHIHTGVHQWEVLPLNKVKEIIHIVR